MFRAAKQKSEWESMLAEQVRLNSRLFYRLAYGVLRDATAAEDICQQAFLKACKQQDQIRDHSALKSWLARVVVSESLQVVRRRRTEDRHRLQAAPAADGGMSVSDKMEFMDSFRVALAELPETTQMVVVMRLVEGLSGNEVKSMLGCTASEVSRRLHYGIEHIRQRLASSYVPD